MEIHNQLGQRVGEIVGDQYVSWRTQKHFMFKYTGFGLSRNILGQLVQNNVREIIIKYQGVKKITTYQSNIDQWLKSDKFHTFKVDGLPDDEQVFVSKNDMKELN